MPLTIGSPAFSENGSIPREYTCEGADTAPELQWAGAPATTKSFVLIVMIRTRPTPMRRK